METKRLQVVEPLLVVGVDWAREAHVACLYNVEADSFEELRIEHSGPAIHRFVERLAQRAGGSLERVIVGIEVPRGGLVEMLLERGVRVFALNPKQLDRFRDRFFPSGSKDDSKDAQVLARCLHTDRICYREVSVDEPLVLQLREHVRVHDDLKDEANRLANRMSELLVRYFPALMRLCPSADEAWLLDLLERAPTPERARRLRPGTLRKLLRANRIRRFSAEQLREALHEAPLELTAGSVSAAASHVSLLIPRMRLVHAQQKQVKRRLDLLLEALTAPQDDDEARSEHCDVEVLRSMPGVGTVIAATVLAEASQALLSRDYNALRAHAGVAPITRQTGKQKQGSSRRPRVGMRYACNGRLRNALYHQARVASQHDSSSKAYYSSLRARGHTHGRALRSVADRLLRILMAALRNGQVYDPTRFETPDPLKAAA